MPRCPERRDQDLVHVGLETSHMSSVLVTNDLAVLRSSCAHSPRPWEKWTAPHRCSGGTGEMVHVRLWVGAQRGKGRGQGSGRDHGGTLLR